MRQILLVLPFPPRILNPNARPHRMVKAAAARDYRYLCYIEALQARDRKRIALEAPVRAVVTFVCGQRLWDQDNLTAAFKPGWDGIVEAGLIPDDNPEALMVETRVIKGGKREVRVELESVYP